MKRGAEGGFRHHRADFGKHRNWVGIHRSGFGVSDDFDDAGDYESGTD